MNPKAGDYRPVPYSSMELNSSGYTTPRSLFTLHYFNYFIKQKRSEYFGAFFDFIVLLFTASLPRTRQPIHIHKAHPDRRFPSLQPSLANDFALQPENKSRLNLCRILQFAREPKPPYRPHEARPLKCRFMSGKFVLYKLNKLTIRARPDPLPDRAKTKK